MPLTKRQREILNYLTTYSEQNGFAPSFEEIAENFNYNSLATVHEHLTNLERKGYIKRSYNESRAIEILPSEATPARDRAAAARRGRGRHADRGDRAQRDDHGARDASSGAAATTTCSRVRGNSMVDEQIRDGDFVVVNERQRADNGEMVIAHAQRQLGDGQEVLPRARRPHPAAAGERDHAADLRARERHRDPGHRRRRAAAVLSAGALRPMQIAESRRERAPQSLERDAMPAPLPDRGARAHRRRRRSRRPSPPT